MKKQKYQTSKEISLQHKHIDGMEIPTEITKEGWIFDPRKGTQIQGKYIFGESKSVNENNLKFSIRRKQSSNLKKQNQKTDESIIVVVIIAVISIGAAIFYLKGYKK